MKLKGRPVLMVAEVETADGISLETRSEVTAVGTPTGRLTSVRRTDDYVHYRASHYLPTQPARIPVLHRHDRAKHVGTVEYLRWIEPDNRIMAVCEVEVDEAAYWLARGECFVSPSTRSSGTCGRPGRWEIEVDHLWLVESTARVAARPVTWSVTTFEERCKWHNTLAHFNLLREAAEARRKRRGTDVEMPIVGHPDIPPPDELPPLFRTAAGPIRTTSSPFDDRGDMAVRAGADPWKAGGSSGAMLWDGPNGVTYGIR